MAALISRAGVLNSVPRDVVLDSTLALGKALQYDLF